MKRILAFGTFDKFHPGHEYVLTQAKHHGDYLVVVVARDDNVEQLKGKRPRDNEHLRVETVQDFDPVDFAMLGFQDFKRRMEILELVQPDVIVLGYDQAPGFEAPSEDIEVIRIDSYYPEKYKSSLL